MYLNVIIPCLNEEKTIGDVISKVPRDINGITSVDVIVVDDGSTDNTAGIARENGAIVISHPDNLGVGAAFQTGVNEAIRRGSDIIVSMDGDGQFNPEDIAVLTKPILEGQADFVTASRFKKKDLVPEMPFIKKWGNRQISRIVSFLVENNFSDVSCGFRAYSQETALNLNLFGKFTYTHETFLDLAFKGKRIVEIPVRVKGAREFGESRVASNLWLYGINALKIILRTYRDYKPMRFFGFLSLSFLIIASGLGLFFFAHYLRTGAFSPHLWAGFISGFSFFMAIIFFVTGLLADMLDRIRRNQETLLYLSKKDSINRNLKY